MVVALTGLARSLRVRRKADAENAELRGVSSLLHGNISGAIIGAFYTVHTELGSGFLEAVYVNAMTVLLQLAGVRVDRQVPFDIRFHGQHLGTYRADLVVEDRIIVEIKAGRTIIPQHTAQVLNYLKASRLQVGLLLNFGEKAQFKRVICTRSPPRNSA